MKLVNNTPTIAGLGSLPLFSTPQSEQEILDYVGRCRNPSEVMLAVVMTSQFIEERVRKEYDNGC